MAQGSLKQSKNKDSEFNWKTRDILTIYRCMNLPDVDRLFQQQTHKCRPSSLARPSLPHGFQEVTNYEACPSAFHVRNSLSCKQGAYATAMRPAILTLKFCISSSCDSNENDIEVKRPVLQFCGQRDHLKTKLHSLSSYQNRSGIFYYMRVNCRSKHDVTFSKEVLSVVDVLLG